MLKHIKNRFRELELIKSHEQTLIDGLRWFKVGSEFDQESPSKHAIRITDILVDRASALLSHISIMIAIITLVFQYYFPDKTQISQEPIIAVSMILEILLYLFFTLLCLQAIHISGSRSFDISSVNPEDNYLNKKIFELIEDARNHPEASTGEVIKFYNAWENENKVKLLNVRFAKYIMLVLSRRRAYLRALIGTYIVTACFIITTTVKFIINY